MSNFLTRRLNFWTSAFYNKLRAAVAIMIAILSAITVVRDTLLNPQYRNWFLLKYLPTWAWYWWIIALLGSLLLLTLEGTFQVYQRDRSRILGRHKARVSEIRRDYQRKLTNAHLEELITGKNSVKEKQVTVTAEERRLFGSYALADEPQEESQVTAQKADPILVCKRVYVTPVHWSGFTFTVEKEPKEDCLYAAVAEFVNRPHAKGYVPPVSYLEAQITYYDDKGEYYGRTAHGFWMEKVDCFFDLDAGDIGQLIIAVGHRGLNIFAVDNYRAGAVNYDQKPPVELVGKCFRVQVYLSASHGVNETTFFEVAVKPDELFTIKIADEREH
jgi:hypothetical protein